MNLGYPNKTNFARKRKLINKGKIEQLDKQDKIVLTKNADANDVDISSDF